MSYRSARPRMVRSRCHIEWLEDRRLMSVVNGLTGTYFQNADLTSAVLTRVDAQVNSAWDTGSPAAAIEADTFSARWTGQVQADVSGTYTFYTRADDGVRLWVNNQLLIDRWQNQTTAQTYSANFNLVAGQKYDLKLEYYENTGSAIARLQWSGPGIAKVAIPKTNLFTTAVVPPAKPTGLIAQPVNSTTMSLSWNNVASETGYKIERRRDNATDPWKQIATTAADVTQFTDTGLTGSTSYRYRVRAYNADGESPYSAVAVAATLAPKYDVSFSTYLGGSGFEQVRDVTTDAAGNIYVAGGGGSTNFPTTPGAFDTTPNGSYDIFVTKYSPAGQMIWSTVVGGTQYDRAYGIEVDSAGYVYIAGRAGPGLPTTAGAFQPTYNGFYSGSAYGNQNAFVAKLKPDGSGLVFASYFGSYELIRDLAIDANGDIYVAASRKATETGTASPTAWFANAFQKTPTGGADTVVAKIKSDGSAVLWATYYGGTGNDGLAPSIRVDSSGRPVVVGQTNSTNLPTSVTGYDRTYNGGANDVFVAKFSADGSQLLFGTYLGGSGGEGTETHNLALDSAGNVYVSSGTTSANFPVTTGAYQTTHTNTASNDAFIAKLSADGTTLLASTFYGGSAGEATEGINVDAAGNVYISGPTSSTNLKMTADAFRNTNAGGSDMFVAKFNSNLTTLIYATYVGGTGADQARSSWVDSLGNIYLVGQVEGGFFTRNAAQGTYAGATDGALVKLLLQ